MKLSIKILLKIYEILFLYVYFLCIFIIIIYLFFKYYFKEKLNKNIHFYLCIIVYKVTNFINS